jgi:translation elongation factor EF-G
MCGHILSPLIPPPLHTITQTWLPASEALLEMIIYHLPSPAFAQKYRVDVLYEGPLDDAYATAIRLVCWSRVCDARVSI